MIQVCIPEESYHPLQFPGMGCICPGGGLCSGGSLSRGSLSRSVSLLGGLCPGGLCPGGLCPGVSLSKGVSVQGVSFQGDSVKEFPCRGVSVQGCLCPEVDSSPVNRMTDASKTLTFPKLHLRVVKMSQYCIRRNGEREVTTSNRHLQLTYRVVFPSIFWYFFIHLQHLSNIEHIDK